VKEHEGCENQNREAEGFSRIDFLKLISDVLGPDGTPDSKRN